MATPPERRTSPDHHGADDQADIDVVNGACDHRPADQRTIPSDDGTLHRAANGWSAGWQPGGFPQAFATAWNHSVEGTQVPALSQGPAPPPNFTQESVGGVAAYVANLGGNVWLAALARAPTALARALLVWEPNVDSAQQPAENALYRDAFQALAIRWRTAAGACGEPPGNDAASGPERWMA